jgi:thioredoxin reductase (NADPH)
MIGGQCSALYPEKPIYDIPAFSKIDAQDLINNLAEQARPFNPVYHLSQSVIELSGDANMGFTLTTSKATKIHAKAIIIAAGAGAFGANKPPLKDLDLYEDTSIFYMVKNRNDFKNKNIIIAGGGDSAVDWAISLSDIAKKVTLIHRRDVFKAAPASLEKMRNLAQKNIIDIITPAQPVGLVGNNGVLTALQVRNDNHVITDLPCDIVLPFYGLATNLGHITEWGFNLNRNHIIVTPTTAQTNREGIYAIGDVATYDNKLKLILTGFSEAATAAHHAYGIVHQGQALHFEYSTGKGVPSFHS